VRLKPKEKKGFCFSEDGKKTKNYTWSKTLARVFQIDVLKCTCGGELKPIAAIFEQSQIERFLIHINISPSLFRRSFSEVEDHHPLRQQEWFKMSSTGKC
jgi:hypothetical protein